MKVKVEMMIEVSKEGAEDWEIKSHLRDALASYTGNEIEFWDCQIEKCRPALQKFDDGLQAVICLESFTATHSNYIAGKVVKETKEFIKGANYPVQTWRPEGSHIGGFFVFHKNASHFAEI